MVGNTAPQQSLKREKEIQVLAFYSLAACMQQYNTVGHAVGGLRGDRAMGGGNFYSSYWEIFIYARSASAFQLALADSHDITFAFRKWN